MAVVATRFVKFAVCWWPSAVVVALILYATLSEHPAGVDELPLIPHIDKLIHAVMMGGLVGALVFDYKRAHRSAGMLSTSVMLRIVFAVMFFGIVDELAQEWLTEARGGDVADVAADWLGAWVAFFTAPPAVCRVLRCRR